jgi:hypothetical protein
MRVCWGRKDLESENCIKQKRRPFVSLQKIKLSHVYLTFSITVQGFHNRHYTSRLLYKLLQFVITFM